MKRRTALRVGRTIVRVLVISALLAGYWAASYFDTHYRLESTVTDVTGEIVTVVDITGTEWQFKGYAEEGETLVMTMWNAHTISNTDDEILKVRSK